LHLLYVYIYIEMLLRHLYCHALNVLEYTTMNIPFIRDWVLAVHHSAFQRLLRGCRYNRILVVGGGIYPRTAIIMKSLYPHAQITIQDKSRESLKIAEAYLQRTHQELNISYLHKEYILSLPATTQYSTEYSTVPATTCGTNITTVTTTLTTASQDLVICPLAFQSISTSRPIHVMYTRVRHCWIWEHTDSKKTTLVSYLLLKKLVLED